VKLHRSLEIIPWKIIPCVGCNTRLVIKKLAIKRARSDAGFFFCIVFLCIDASRACFVAKSLVAYCCGIPSTNPAAPA